MDIYLKTGTKTGLHRAIQMTDPGGSFIVRADENLQPTQIHSAISKINRDRDKKGLDRIKMSQRKILAIDPKTSSMTTFYSVERL